MKLEEIKEVRYAHSESEINEALNDGFVIFDRPRSVKVKYGDIEEVKPLVMLARKEQIREILKEKVMKAIEKMPVIRANRKI